MKEWRRSSHFGLAWSDFTRNLQSTLLGILLLKVSEIHTNIMENVYNLCRLELQHLITEVRITMAKIRMAHASTHGARKPPGQTKDQRRSFRPKRFTKLIQSTEHDYYSDYYNTLYRDVYYFDYFNSTVPE